MKAMGHMPHADADQIEAAHAALDDHSQAPSRRSAESGGDTLVPAKMPTPRRPERSCGASACSDKSRS